MVLDYAGHRKVADGARTPGPWSTPCSFLTTGRRHPLIQATGALRKTPPHTTTMPRGPELFHQVSIRRGNRPEGSGGAGVRFGQAVLVQQAI